MKLKRTGLVRVGAWILTGLLAESGCLSGLRLGANRNGAMGRRFSERL